MTAVKISGMSNFSVILIPGVVSIIMGIFFVTLINPVTSVSLKKYEAIRGHMKKIKITLLQLQKTQYGLKK